MGRAVIDFRQDLERRRPESREEAGTVMLLSRALAMLHSSELALMFKNPHFSDEEEWRLILLLNESNDPLLQRINFSQRGDFVKPCIDLAVVETNMARMPIVRVICGPKLNAHLAESSAEYFLQARGYKVRATASELARTWR